MRMKRLAVVVVLVAGTAAADKLYSSEKTATHDCGREPNVQIAVSGGTYTLTGACEKVLVTGVANTVTIASSKSLAVNGAKNSVDIGAADRITVNGNGNSVTYKRSVDPKAKAKVSSNGPNNKVTQVP